MQQKLNAELQRFSVLLSQHRLEIVRGALNKLEEIGGKFPAFVQWLLGAVEVNNRGQIVSNTPLSQVPHRAFIHLWMVGWQAKQGDLRLQNIEMLDLRGIGVIEFPAVLKYAKNLSVLRLEGNPIHSLCSGICSVSIDQNQLHRFTFVEKEYASPLRVSVNFSGIPTKEDAYGSDIRKISKVVSIRISNPAVSELPGWIQDIETLEELQISGCRLSSLPDWIGDFPLLRRLEVSDQIGGVVPRLPSRLGRLVELEILKLENIGLRHLPEWVRKLSNLHSLQLGGNLLEDLPLWFAELSSLWQLWLPKNPFLSCPPVLRRMSSLREVGVYSLPDERGNSQKMFIEELKEARPDVTIFHCFYHHRVTVPMDFQRADSP